MGTNKITSAAVKRTAQVQRKNLNLDDDLGSKTSVEQRANPARSEVASVKRATPPKKGKDVASRKKRPDHMENSDDDAGMDDENDPFKRPSLFQDNQLPYIPARKGFVQRWVRYETRYGQVDKSNIRKMQAMDWQPRPAATVHKNFNLAPEKSPQFGDVIIVQGNILCERTVARNEYWRKMIAAKTRHNEQAVRQDIHKDLTEQEKRLAVDPSYESRQKVTKRTVQVAPDDDEQE